MSEEKKNVSLEELLSLSNKKDDTLSTSALSEERIKAILPELRSLIAFFREYPDLFIDFLIKDDPECNFKFYFYQRIFLRVVMRHKYVYATFPRASMAPITFLKKFGQTSLIMGIL